jgi:hypothetical protein
MENNLTVVKLKLITTKEVLSWEMSKFYTFYGDRSYSLIKSRHIDIVEPYRQLCHLQAPHWTSSTRLSTSANASENGELCNIDIAGLGEWHLSVLQIPATISYKNHSVSTVMKFRSTAEAFQHIWAILSATVLQ